MRPQGENAYNPEPVTDLDPTTSAAPDPEANIPLARPITFLTTAAPIAPPHPILLLDHSRRAAWRDLALVLLALVAFELLAVGLLRTLFAAYFDSGLEQDDASDAKLRQAALLPVVSFRAVTAALAIAYVTCRRRQPWTSLGLTTRGVLTDIAIGIGALPAVYGLIALTMLAVWFLYPGLIGQMNENAERLMTLIPRLSPLQFVPVSLLIGVYEELLFRGFMMPRLRRTLGGWTPALLVSSAVFTALHAFEQTPLALIVVAILSLVFSLATIWRRSILPAIVTHALFDFSQLLLLYFSSGDAWK